MNWMQNLYDTYNYCAGNTSIPDSGELYPISHTTQQAHIEISIDKKGAFKNARVLENKIDQKTLIPCTEESAGRSGVKPKNHPLCDKLQYVAGDFSDFNGVVTKGFLANPSEPFEMFLKALTDWCNSEFCNEMVTAILAYISKKHLIQDLVDCGILVTDDSVAYRKSIMTEWNDKDSKAPPIFRAVPSGQTPTDAFVRFRIFSAGTLVSGTWESSSLIQSWINYYASTQSQRCLCIITGEERTLAEQHPGKIRHDADKAKLISSNDQSGYTFKGRFTDAAQVTGVSFEATQKAHSALRWLIRRKQAFRNGDQVIVSWALGGVDIPDPLANTLDFLGQQEEAKSDHIASMGDVGQSFSLRLSKKIAGYEASISDSENIVVMGLDSATPGRMSITFYRELTGSEFLCRIEKWHSSFSWYQNFGKDTHFVGAAAPKDIALAAYGKRAEGKNGTKLLNATVERLLPCIIDGARFPTDLVSSCIRRTSNRIGLEPWEWEKCLGISCSIYRGTSKERGYRMALEEDRKTRDYLYGRLLAVGEQIESMALYYAKEKRDTTASRLMQRFADRPSSTWKTIENALVPYKTRINSKAPGLLAGYKELLDNIHSLFVTDEYNSNKVLSGEFLLGYHCQRKWLREHKREKGVWIEKIETDSSDSDPVEE